MFDYLINTPFKTTTRTMNKGEALRLSSTSPKAMQLVVGGYLVEVNVGLDLLSRFDSRVNLLMDKLAYPRERAVAEATAMITACLKRHESLKKVVPPSEEFLHEVAEFNKAATGKNPISKEQSEKGVGEWAGYRCNIGTGCAHGCLYCYAENFATRFGRVGGSEGWREEVARDVATADCKKYPEPIMFPTTHDVTAAYLQPYRCHLHNILNAGNAVVIVSKPHEESIRAICTEFSSFRDNMTFRFSIGGLDNEAMRIWEPGAPVLAERLKCLRIAFEHGFKTSISAEPMLGDSQDAERLYYVVEPFITEDIWFGKMRNVGRHRKSSDPEVVRRATKLIAAQSDQEIIRLVDAMKGLPKVRWKDSIQDVIKKHHNDSNQ